VLDFEADSIRLAITAKRHRRKPIDPEASQLEDSIGVSDMAQYTTRRLEIDLVKRFTLRLDELREQFAGSAAIYSSCLRQP
jgi:hypothetical protein